MFHVHRLFSVGLVATVLAAGCTGKSPAAPDMAATGSRGNQDAASAAVPPFNLEAVLRGTGFGLVEFRQDQNPAANIINLDVWVRDLAPNASYSLQRATDSALDGACTGSNWLTLGKGTVDEPILTDDSGTGRASLWRDLSFLAPGTGFDIYFRIVATGTSEVVLQSDCYRFVVRD
jgi:hypothetical protein